jgi:hypothetical protein
MSGTAYADIRVAYYASADLLPAEAACLLDKAGSVFAGRTWWSVVLAHAMPPDASGVFVLCHTPARVLAVVPMLRQGRRLDSLTTPYTCCYAPVFADGLDLEARTAAMAAFAGVCRSGVTRLDALPEAWDGLPALLAGVRQAGLLALRFDHFGNWHEDVRGLDWSGYLSRRPGALRETIRRRLRQADRLPDAVFALLTGQADLDRAAAAFESVYARSWKQPEPYPRFNVTLMRAMAGIGCLRFGLWSIAGTAVAVQIWVMQDGHATVLKLAHDEAFKAHSPGTVLTALMLRHLLDHEGVAEIDFGRGDDGYKQGWASRRRQRVGVLVVNPWRPAGAVALARHVGGRVWNGVRRRFAQGGQAGR